MLIGVIGHIDHGKTALVKALTGVDTDRLPEEKARGITLDLGYAYCDTLHGRRFGFIDMPGHEKLIHNMLAGAIGLDFVLLVIAADDGVMAQTREHLELVDLLNLRRGAVVLNKCDRVDEARLAALREEITTLLRPTHLAAAPLFIVSALRGTGIAALRAHLDEVSASLPARAFGGHFRLAIDRTFTLAGLGTAVSGTAHSGEVRVGDELRLSPGGAVVRVKSLHVQDRPAQTGRAGERCAVVLAGEVKKQEIVRGMWLSAPPLALPLTRFAAYLRVPSSLPTLHHWTPVHVHLGSDDIIGRVALLDTEAAPAGTEALAEILLARPTLAVRGDRFILRSTDARHTVAGGQVLDTAPPTRKKRSAERLNLLRAMRNGDAQAVLMLLLTHAPAGVDLTTFAAGWNLREEELAALEAQLNLVVVALPTGRIGFSTASWVNLQSSLLMALTKEHERQPELPGATRERLRRLLLPNLPGAAFARLVDEARAAGQILQTRAWLHLPQHQAHTTATDLALFQRLRPFIESAPYNPPRVRDIHHTSGIAEDEVRQLFRRLARAGDLYLVAQDHFFTAAAISDLARIVAELCQQHGATRAAELRDVIFAKGGGGRKVAIHILEFFDRIGYTRRAADRHKLRSEAAFMFSAATVE